MSVLLTGAVKQRGPEQGPLRHTLWVICDEADDFGFACPSTESLADGSCCSVRQVVRRVQLLEEQGWLKVKRKVFRGGKGESANAYFVDTEKLGIERSKQTRRSPLWTNVLRLLKALESRDKVSLLNGVLKFEKTPESLDIPDSGNLFEDDSASDTMSLVDDAETTAKDANLAGPRGISGKTVGKVGNNPLEADFAGDMVSRDMCHPCHVTSDIDGKPFNVLPVINPFQPERTPLPPASGGSAPTETDLAPGLQTADREVTPKAKLAAQLVWATARVMRGHSFSADRRIEDAISEALELHCSKTRQTPEQAADLEAKNYAAWLEQSHLMTHNWGWRWWFKRGYWAKPGEWPFDRKLLAQQRHAQIGMDQGGKR